MIEIAAAVLVWLGASSIVLADGRRGLALGLGLATAGLAGLAWQAGEGVAVLALAAGGAAAAYRRLGAGPDAWRMMPPGSTPRLVLCIAAGIVALWFAATVTTGSGAALRFGVLAVVVLMAVRVVTSRHPAIVLTAVACLALAIAPAAGLGTGSPDAIVLIAGGLIAFGTMLVRETDPEAA